MMRNKRIYLDYAASTPIAPEVEQAMRPYFLKKFGNAGSLHSFGQEALAAVDNARETIAKAINANFREVIFTGSATEANNLALRGALRGVKGQGSRVKRPRIIVSAIEHESVLETARDLSSRGGSALGGEQDGVEVVIIPVDRNGIINLKKLKSALNERTILVSVMYANNEIGTIQPISEIAKIISDFRKGLGFRVEGLEKGKKLTPNPYALYPLFHTDAVQAFQSLDCNVGDLGVDMMTLSAHKIYGPKGIGALYVRQVTSDKQNGKTNSMSHVAFSISPIITGGNQEFGLRSGTENVPLIVGFAKAVELASANRNSEFQRIKKLKDYFWQGLKKIYPRAERNSDLERSLPNILNIYFPSHEAQYVLTKFDLAGIAVSAGSACSARSIEPSYVIKALGYSDERAKHSIRFSFGRPTTKKDIDSAIGVIRKLL